MAKNENGVWRTISGRRVFIRTGQSLTEAMKESGKFDEEEAPEVGHVDEFDLRDALSEGGLSEEEIEEMLSTLRSYTDDYGAVMEDPASVALINKAIAAAESAHWNGGELYRGVNMDEETWRALSIGDVIEDAKPTSWTSDMSVAVEFSKTTHDELSFVLVDSTDGPREAVSIADLSRFADEYEVLHAGGSAFEVVDWRDEETVTGTVRIIEVKEVRRK